MGKIATEGNVYEITGVSFKIGNKFYAVKHCLSKAYFASLPCKHGRL